MPSPFRPANDLMVQYAEYHRDRRNIASHLVGVPMIVFAVGVLLGRPGFAIAGLALTPAWVIYALAAIWYVTRGPGLLTLATAAVVGLLIALGQPLAAASTAGWLGCGIGAFVVGWVIQFVGHHYEGRKPAFVDDVIGLLVGPMFVVGEVLFAAGLCPAMAAEIERRAGPTHLRDLTRPASR